MNRLQLWKVVSVALLACGLASAQHITTFSAPGAGTGAGQGTGGFGINPQGTVVGSFLDSDNVFHGFQCVSGCASPRTFTTFNAPGAGAGAFQGTITFSINACGVMAVRRYIDQPVCDAVFFQHVWTLRRIGEAILAHEQGGRKKSIHLATDVGQPCLLADLDATARFACVSKLTRSLCRMS